MTPVFVITFGDVVALVICGLFVATYLYFSIRQYLKQRFCKHDAGVDETRACEAICKKCGENFGFIGNWRKAQGDNND